ncbi:MAG: acyl-ACP--UDP-N-acetylglucosamine O-acyltransferase [Bacteroides sp.]
MISPLAYVDPQATIGKNVTIQPFAYIDKNVEIGDDCIIMSYASILNGTRMGKGNKVYQNAVLGSEPQDFHYTGEESELIIGDKNCIRENVVISRATHKGSHTTIGNENFLMDKVHICHDVQIGNHCVAGIGSVIAGECTLNDCVILSGSVSLFQHCRVGSWSLIQGGSRIAKDVPPYVIISGNPAGYHGVNAVVMTHHHNMSERILRHIANAYRLIYQGNFSLFDALQKIEDQVPMSDEIHSIINFCRDSKQGIVK